MRLAFVVNPAYVGVSGSIVYGGSGETLDLQKEIVNGGIETDNPRIQAALYELSGRDGKVFTAFKVVDGNRMPYEPGVSSAFNLPHRVGATKPPKPQATITAMPEAEHGGSGSGYEGLKKEELKEEAINRGLDVKSNSSVSELIELLEQADAKETGSGS